MATQFYKPVKWATQEELAQMALLEDDDEFIEDSEYLSEDEFVASLDNIKRLAGLDTTSASLNEPNYDRSERHKFIKENNIKPGTPRWFRVMYARPDLTGEDPFGE